MASKVVEETIQDYLAANWTDSAIFTENLEQETPVDGTPFIILQFPAMSVIRLAVSNRTYAEEGGFRIVINLRRGEGVQRMRDWGEQLATLFRDVRVGEVECLVPTEPFTDDESESGSYFSGTMVCQFRRVFPG